MARDPQRQNTPTQPIPSLRYDKGKKAGGSGFGHYYARRIISEFCGGRSERRRLDVRIDDCHNEAALVRVNLLQAIKSTPRLVTTQELLEAAAANLKEVKDRLALDNRNNPIEGTWRIPKNIDLQTLFRSFGRLLILDQQLKKASLSSYLLDVVCAELCEEVEKVRKMLVEALDRALETGSPASLKSMRDDLANPKVIRGRSFHDLREWLKRWLKSDRARLTELVEGDEDESLRSRLSRFVTDSSPEPTLKPTDLLTAKDREKLELSLRQYDPYLKEDVSSQGLEALLKDLHSDREFKPVPNPTIVTSAFREGRWECAVRQVDGRLLFALRLRDDGATQEPLTLSDHRGDRGLPVVDVSREFSSERLARIFAQYQSSFEDLPDADDTEGVTMVRQPGDVEPAGVLSRTIYCELGPWNQGGVDNQSGARHVTRSY